MGKNHKRRGISRRARGEIREYREAEQQNRRTNETREARRGRQLERRLAERLAESRKPTAERVLARYGNLRQKGGLRTQRFDRIVEIVCERRPRLIEEDSSRLFWALSSVHWARAVEQWRPAGRGVRRGLRSLIDHLLVSYPVPPFLYRALLESAAGQACDSRVITLFMRAASGMSLHAILRDLFPVPLTRRMTALLIDTPEDFNLIPALRRVQLLASGGSESLARAVSGTRLGREFQRNEDFWSAVLHWFCRQAVLEDSEVGPLIDYIDHCRIHNQDFAITGRSLKALRAGMRDWHRELARMEKLRGRVFDRSGFAEGIWEGRPLRSGLNPPLWTMEEILCSKDLAREGRVMHHCVASYNGGIESGWRSIWSLRMDDEPFLTIEVLNGTRQVVQARGRRNRSPRPAELNYLRRWSRDNALTVSGCL